MSLWYVCSKRTWWPKHTINKYTFKIYVLEFSNGQCSEVEVSCSCKMFVVEVVLIV